MAPTSIIESTCLTLIKDALWPVFVFPDHSVPVSFVRTRESKTALPVLILGRHQFAWKAPNELLEFVPSEKYIEEEPANTPKSRFQVERIEAFEEAMQFHDIVHYHDLVKKKERAARVKNLTVVDDDDDSEVEIMTPKWKGKGKRKTIQISDSEDEPSVLRGKRARMSTFKNARFGLPTPNPTPSKPSKFLPNPFVFDEEDFEEDGISDDELPCPSTFKPRSRVVGSVLRSEGGSGVVTPSKRPVLSSSTPSKKPSILSSVTPSKKPPTSSAAPAPKPFKLHPNDFVAQEQYRLLTMKKDGKRPVQVEEEVIEASKDPSKVNIYIGPEEKLYVLSRDKIDKHPSFTDHIKGSESDGYEIRSKFLSESTTKLFDSVVEYLNTSDYKPQLMPGSEFLGPYLKGVNSDNQLEAAAEHASLLWNTAHELGLDDLKSLIRRKILAQSPLFPNSLLILTRMVFWFPSTGSEVDEEMRLALKEEIARRFYELVGEEALVLTRIMGGNRELREHVYGRLKEDPDLGLVVERDGDSEDEFVEE